MAVTAPLDRSGLSAERARRHVWPDNLRVAVIVGVIGAHVSLIYALDVGWYYEERSASEVAKDANIFLDGCSATMQPMAGSSVHFDRMFLKQFMEPFEKAFHYRNIDVSTLKEVFSRIDPLIVDNRPQPQARHRALEDCYDTIEELRYYLAHMGAF